MFDRLWSTSSTNPSSQPLLTPSNLNKGISLHYIDSTGIHDPTSHQDLKCAIDSAYEINRQDIPCLLYLSQDFLRVINKGNGSLMLCVPIVAIRGCTIGAGELNTCIGFSAGTSINPKHNTIHIAHVFETQCPKDAENLFRVFDKKIESAQKQLTSINKTDIEPVFIERQSEAEPSPRVETRDTYTHIQPCAPGIKTISRSERFSPVSAHDMFKSAFHHLKHGNQEQLKKLFASGFSAQDHDDSGQTLLHFSVHLDNLTMCQFLISFCGPGQDVFGAGVHQDNHEVEILVGAQDKEGKTALHIAAAKGLPHFVRFLANNHASVNVKDIKGRTPLHYCAGKIESLEVMHILVERGAKINLPDIDGIKPSSIENGLQEMQKRTVDTAFKFITSLNVPEHFRYYSKRTNMRSDSGLDIACSEREWSEGTSVHSPEGSSVCCSPHQDSLSSIPEQDRRSEPFNSSDEMIGLCEYSPNNNDKMRCMRDALSSLLWLSHNEECHNFMLSHLGRAEVHTKLVRIARCLHLSERSAEAIALIFKSLFKEGRSQHQFKQHGLLRPLISLLESHTIVQTQAISLLEELMKLNTGPNGDQDYISEFAELQPEFLLTLLQQQNELSSLSSKPNKQNVTYARRMRSLSSPGEFADTADNLKSSNSCITRNMSRRLIIRIISRTSYFPVMQDKLGHPNLTKQLMELMDAPTTEVAEHAVLTLANMALSSRNHILLQQYGVEAKLKELIRHEKPHLVYHSCRALIYLGHIDLPYYIFDYPQGLKNDILWSNHKEDVHVFAKAASLEDICEMLTNDPKLLWGGSNLRSDLHCDTDHPTKATWNQIINFILSLHVTFVDSIVFLRVLLHRFRDPRITTQQKRVIPPVHHEVCSVLLQWLTVFPHHFHQQMVNCVEQFIEFLDGPAYYQYKCQIIDAVALLDGPEPAPVEQIILHESQYLHCRDMFLKEEIPLALPIVGWLTALRGIIETLGVVNTATSIFSYYFKEREVTSKLRAILPEGYKKNSQCIEWVKKFYRILNQHRLSRRQCQHMFVDTYYSQPLYGAALFTNLSLHLNQSSIPVVVGVNTHHVVVFSETPKQIIDHHHPITTLKELKPKEHYLDIRLEEFEYRFVAPPFDLEELATAILNNAGKKLEVVNLFDIDDNLEDSEELKINFRHSNGYMKLESIPRSPKTLHRTTPLRNSIRNSYFELSQQDFGDEESLLGPDLLTTARSRLSLNIGHAPFRLPSLRRAQTASDVREHLDLLEDIPTVTSRRESLHRGDLRRTQTASDFRSLQLHTALEEMSPITSRLRSFSNALSTKLEKRLSERAEEGTEEEMLPKMQALGQSLTGPSNKRVMRRSPRLANERHSERGIVNIDPETSQETVIITEKRTTKGVLTAPQTAEGYSIAHRVKHSTVKDLDAAAFAKLIAQSKELMAVRKRRNSETRRGSSETLATPPNKLHLSRSRHFSTGFENVLSNQPSKPEVYTPVELKQFPCLTEEARQIDRVQYIQERLSRKCSCFIQNYTVCDCPPEPDIPHEFDFDHKLNEVELLSYHREIARQLTLLDHERFCQVEQMDLIHYAQQTVREPVLCESVKKCADHFNTCSQWVRTIVLNCEHLNIRVKMIEHLIDIAHQCALFRNFSAVFAIIPAGLGTASIRNLTETWLLISEPHLSLFNQYTTIMLPSFNYKIYRTLLNSNNEPTVPYLHLYLKDLLFSGQGNPDCLRQGMINLHKRRIFYTILEEVKFFQGKQYNFEALCDVHRYFQGLRTYSDEEYYNKSLLLQNQR